MRVLHSGPFSTFIVGGRIKLLVASRGARRMLLKLSEHIRECVAQAADAHAQAINTTDPAQKSALLDIEDRWMKLVENYKFLEQASRFVEDADRNRLNNVEPVAKSDNSHATLLFCEKCGGKMRLIDFTPATHARDLQDIWTFRCELCAEEIKRLVDK
jgi:hypothetical protein